MGETGQGRGDVERGGDGGCREKVVWHTSCGRAQGGASCRAYICFPCLVDDLRDLDLLKLVLPVVQSVVGVCGVSVPLCVRVRAGMQCAAIHKQPDNDSVHAHTEEDRHSQPRRQRAGQHRRRAGEAGSGVGRSRGGQRWDGIENPRAAGACVVNEVQVVFFFFGSAAAGILAPSSFCLPETSTETRTTHTTSFSGARERERESTRLPAHTLAPFLSSSTTTTDHHRPPRVWRACV